jgi:hypothetical protein
MPMTYSFTPAVLKFQRDLDMTLEWARRANAANADQVECKVATA